MEDDGQVVADMSHVPQAGFSGFGVRGKKKETKQYVLHPDQEPYTAKERFRYTLAALKAALIIGFAYLIGFVVIIGLIMLMWEIL